MAGPVGWCSPDNHTCDFMSRPFEKAISRKQAPAAREGIAEGGLTRDRLRACLDRLESNTGVCRPRRNQAPASQREVPLRSRWILANNSDGLRRGDVVEAVTKHASTEGTKASLTSGEAFRDRFKAAGLWLADAPV